MPDIFLITGDCSQNLIVFTICTSRTDVLNPPDQVKAAGLSLYNNEWSDIYDFSPVPLGLNYSAISKVSRFYRSIYITICAAL